MNGLSILAVANMDVSKILNEFFASVFSDRIFQACILRESVQGGERLEINEDLQDLLKIFDLSAGYGII